MRKKRSCLAGICLILCLSGCAKTQDTEVPAVQYMQEEETPSEEPVQEQPEIPEEEEQPEPERVPAGPVKGIYVTGPIAGHERMSELEQLAASSELNAMVIDIKNDEGIVTYQMEQPMVEELEVAVRYIPDLPELVKRLKEQDVYLIARIVAFKDPLLAQKRPEWCVHRKDGSVFLDKNGLAWVNPYCREVWEYLLDLAKEAAAAGFDEIQFDYIRFPTEIRDEEVDYGEDSQEKSKTEVISEFTAYAYETLSPLGVWVSADVFGTIIDNEYDASLVGQDYREMAMNLDYICPMVYPSHYRDGVYGIEHPDLQPYETVLAALQASEEVLSGIPKGEHRAQVRAWLQDFTASWVNPHQSYGGEQIRSQIQAVYDSGSAEWLLWNAKCSYTEEGLLTEEEALAGTKDQEEDSQMQSEE